MIVPPLLRGRDRYERVVTGRVDDGDGDAFIHTVAVADPERAVELTVVALPSPTYEIRAAAGRALAGDVDPAVLAGLPTLAGVRMVGGLTRRAREAAGAGAGAGHVVDAVIEVARLARQVAKLSRERAERAVAAGPAAVWELDTTGWVDLPDSCFTYSAEGRSRLGTRDVTSAATADLYSPRPGQVGVFERRRALGLERGAARLRLFHSLHDNVHGFDLEIAVDSAAATIVAATAATPRLPYAGICTEPQARLASLVGERVDEGLSRRIQTLLGGVGGCAQLYDLTADLLKLLGPTRG